MEKRKRLRVGFTLLQILMVLIAFFGSAFSLMAYFNDVAIAVVFQQFYESLLGPSKGSFTEVEVLFCIGIVVGVGGYLKNGR